MGRNADLMAPTDRQILRGQPAPVELLPSQQEALAFLLPLSGDYPGIDSWFVSKVAPGLLTGTRTMLRAERDGRLVGLGIAKCEAGEKKICTVRVAPSHAGRGIGVRLFDGLLRWLDTDRPHLTVTEGRLPAFERIFDHYGFSVTSVRDGLYVPHVRELGYNEAADRVPWPAPQTGARTDAAGRRPGPDLTGQACGT